MTTLPPRIRAHARLAWAAALASSLLLIAIAGSVSAAPPPWAPGGARLSAAGERLLREQIGSGGRAAYAVAHRFGLDLPEPDDGLGGAAADATRVGVLGVERALAVNSAPDAQVNDKTGDVTCAGGCGNRPLSQSETTIASLGGNLLAGWNDSKGFCTGGAVQGYGYSTNDGASWTDGGDVPALPTGGRYRGDPVHAVNRKTGRFYILGLYEGGAAGSGLALCSGRFSGGSFVFDTNLQIAVGGADFMDKPWFAVDSISGNVYVSWSNFLAAGGDQIEFRAFDSLGVALGPMQVLSSPAGFGNVQGSRPVVGPDGELDVAWYEYGYPLSHVRIRRSNDFGVSFGPERTVTDFYENGLSGAPGYRRPFAPTLPGIAVDASGGPHRGRVYVTWDEAVDFYDTAFSLASTVPEVENNGFFASATPFTVGNALTGGMSSTSDVDDFRFGGLRGQTIFFAGDTATVGTSLNMRIVCASDTSTLNNYRLLAFNQGRFPAFVFTLPASGDYYLRLNSAVTTLGNYRILTAFDSPTAGERARDHRDQFVATSDDGTTWSTPVRLVDADPWFDGIFPEIAVDGLGRAHVYWHDFRSDAACAALSYEVMTSSGDGGATWGANRSVSDVSSFWSINACGSANQGDYQGITGEGSSVYPCWTDSRLGDPDVFTETARLALSSTCAPSVVYLAASTAPSSGSPVSLTYSLKNEGNATGDFHWVLEDDLGFLTGATPGLSGTVSLAPGDSQIVTADYKGGTCMPARNDILRFITSDVRVPGAMDTCTTAIPCPPPAAVSEGAGRELSFDRPRPNPAHGSVQLRYTLQRAGPVRLTLFGVNGRAVRVLVSGIESAGEHGRTWDARDDHGTRVPPGAYFARLEAEGRVLRRAFMLLR